MVRYNFKIGDNVKLKNPRQFRCGAKVLTIVKEAEDSNKYLHVTYEGINYTYFPLLPHEIEHVSRKGEQLTFSFMEGE